MTIAADMAADSNGRQRVRTVRRRFWTAVALVTVLLSGFLALYRFFEKKFHNTTGPAEWVWIQRKLTTGKPAAFFLARTFDLPADRQYAHVRVAAHPVYTLWVNGRELGGGEASADSGGAALEVHDVTSIVQDRGNRLVVAARSGTGVGGVLVSIDTGPSRQNVVYTTRRWSAYEQWSPQLLHGPAGETSRLTSWGRPPRGPQNTLDTRRVEPPSPARSVRSATAVTPVDTFVWDDRARGGVMIGTRRQVRGTAYDFGLVRGQLRLSRRNTATLEAVTVRFTDDPAEIAEAWKNVVVVFAPGEDVVVMPLVREFRFAIVLESEAVPDVVTAQ